MASYEVFKAKHATLTGTTVDTVEVTGYWRYLEVLNRDGAVPLWVTSSTDPAHAPADPVAEADDVDYVPVGSVVQIAHPVKATTPWTVKVRGNGNGYSVIAIQG